MTTDPNTGPRDGDAPVGDDPRDEAPQFVLPLVLRLERATPPSRTDALQTAARAVLTILSDDRSLGGGEWAGAMRDWQDARIRKVVRRARGAEWRKVQALPGITLTGSRPVDPAEVRVFPPIPLDGWPKDLAKLQVSGTELPEDAAGAGVAANPADAADAADAEDAAHGSQGAGGGGPAALRDPSLPVLWLNPHLEMSAGKACAQAGHGAQLAWWALPEADRKAWHAAGFALAVRVAAPEAWRALLAGGLPVVQDAGFTEIAPGSATVVADHPALRG